MSALSYQAEPQIQYLYQLVRDIAESRIQLPRFQRPYVWTEEQQLELYRSVGSGTPIGTIMLWRTDSLEMKCYDELGPYKLQPPTGSVHTYIIDGHQRLATLFGALHVAPPETKLPSEVAYYDLEAEDFRLAPSDEPPQPLWLPLRFVLDFPKLLPFQRSLIDQNNSDTLIRRTDRIVEAFGQYKIPVITVVTNDLDQVTRTFQRINSQGTVMSEVHMISALTWGKDFDLNDRIERLKEENLAPMGWSDLDDDMILRACKVALGFRLYDKNVDLVGKDLRRTPEVFDDVALALIASIEFLGASCNIYSPHALPYMTHMLPLLEAIRRNPGREQGQGRDTLVRWFWSMAYTTRRIGFERQMEFLDRLGNPSFSAAMPSVRLQPLPPTFNFRQARCRTLALRLAELRDPDLAQTLARHGSDAVPHLLYGWAHVPQPLFESPANRIVVEPSEAPEERRRIREACGRKNRSEADLAFLRRHAISPAAADAFTKQDLDRFYDLRLRALDVLEHDFVQHLSLVSP
jgi:hypothetical protein